MARGPLKHFPELIFIFRPPRFGLRGIKEVLLHGRLDGKREFCVDLVNLLNRARAPSARNGNAQLLCQAVSIPFVPSPLRYFPVRCRNAENLRQRLFVARERSDMFVTSRE